MFEIRDEAEVAKIYIYGTIGEDFWNPEDANRAKQLRQTLDELAPKPLEIHIDSGGGDVYEGFAIAGAIQNYPGKTVTHVDGMAASAASYIALMSDRVVMTEYAFFMIHNAWTLTMGNRDELRDTAARLEGIDEVIAAIIEKRSSLSLDEVREAMSAETWYSGTEALEAGMCDEVIETEERVAARIDARMAKRFNRVPESVTIEDEGDAGDPAPADETALEPETEPAGEEPAADDESSKSHAADNLDGEVGTTVEDAIVLGDRVYFRKKVNHGND